MKMFKKYQSRHDMGAYMVLHVHHNYVISHGVNSTKHETHQFALFSLHSVVFGSE